ncbi:MAG TPA: hypothetical protein VKQ05_12980 [Gemmatimonadales bacterium]|nr:hypothetical protein [Gemmatimonadales bacterium]
MSARVKPLTPSAEVGLCMRYKAVADVLDSAIHCAWFTDDEVWKRTAESARHRATHGDFCYSYGPCEPWTSAREQVLLASALERKDRTMLGKQIRRLAERLREQANAIARTLEGR